jgi:hypothetical protein
MSPTRELIDRLLLADGRHEVICVQASGTRLWTNHDYCIKLLRLLSFKSLFALGSAGEDILPAK